MKTTVLMITFTSVLVGSLAQAADPQPQGQIATKSAAPAAPNPWSISLQSFTDLKTAEEKSIHYSLLSLGYNFSPIVSLNAAGSYTGLLRPKEGKEADFEDPEISLDFSVPINGSNPRNQWTFVGGTMLVIPASRASTSAHMLAGGGFAMGLQWNGGTWMLRQTNKFYAFSYRLTPPTVIETTTDDSALSQLFDDNSSSNESPAAPSGPGSYVTTLHRMEVMKNFTPKFSWKSDGWYITDHADKSIPAQIVRVTSRLGYKWTPNFQTMAGVVSQTMIDENQPPLFDYKTLALRLAIAINN